MKHLPALSLALFAGIVHANLLYSNGPVVDGNGLRISQNYFGQAVGTSFNAGVADDFTVGRGGWNVTDIDFFAYTDQNTPCCGNGVTIFAFTSATWSIVSGDVNTGSVLTSGKTAVGNGGIVGYNVDPSDLGSKRDAIFRLKTDVPDFALKEGTYWLTWSLSVSAFNASVTPVDGEPAGNAMSRFQSNTFVPRNAAYPFSVNGTVSAVPEPASAASLLAGLMGVVAQCRRRSRGLEGGVKALS